VDFPSDNIGDVLAESQERPKIPKHPPKEYILGPSHGDGCPGRHLHRTSCCIRMLLSSELIYDDTVSGALLSCSEQVGSVGCVVQQPFLSSHFHK
jgi:hypothetical protein